jgi:hypothetical protein
MMGRSMSVGGIRISASPSQNGSTVDNEVASPNQSLAQRLPDSEYKERLVNGSPSTVATLALLRRARDTELSVPVMG